MMQFRLYKFALAALILPTIVTAQINGISQEESKLINSHRAISLTQRDFNSGTYRIKRPGHYYLTENITFNPTPKAEAVRKDKPFQGWFAAISVECDNVTIDLNGKTLEQSQEFIDNHVFRVFSHIELNNSPFPHFVFAYPGETELKNAQNVTIKNGTLGRSSHEAIHGNNNKAIHLHNLTIKDWQVAGISLNGLTDSTIKDITLTGLESTVPFTGIFSNMHMALVQLEVLKKNGDIPAQKYIDELKVMLADNTQNGKNTQTKQHDGNTYGILLNRSFNIGPIVTSCGTAATTGVLIENVHIKNIDASVVETVSIANNAGATIIATVFGALRWEDAYPNGSFAPTALLRAQAYTAKKHDDIRARKNTLLPTELTDITSYATQPSARPALPAGAKIFPAGLADAILNNDEATFLQLVQPSFNVDFAGHANKGVFGIRVDCGHEVIIKDCSVNQISNSGNPGQTIADVPGLPAQKRYADSNATQTRYRGNDVYGISFAGCENCHIINCSISDCSTDYGFIYGISIINDSKTNNIINSTSNNHRIVKTVPTSSANPTSTIYGFIIDNHSDANQIISCISTNHEAPYYCKNFFVRNSKNNYLEECKARGSHITSSDLLTNQSKSAIGFSSTASESTTFKQCSSSEMIIENEAGIPIQTNSYAAGFILEKANNIHDNASIIDHCEAQMNDGGAGMGAGILLDGANKATISYNNTHDNYSTNTVGSGYGIRNLEKRSDAAAIGNTASNNATKNYKKIRNITIAPN